MTNAINWIFTIFANCISWLSSWTYADIPFLYYLMGIAIFGIILRYIF